MEKNFIWLNLAMGSNASILVNINFIATVMPCPEDVDAGAVIGVGGSSVLVAESPEYIFSIIKSQS